MNLSLSPTRAEPDPKTGDASDLRRDLKLPVLLGGAGGLGLLACIACCTLPILGAIGIGSRAMAFFEVLEPLSIGLLALGSQGEPCLRSHTYGRKQPTISAIAVSTKRPPIFASWRIIGAAFVRSSHLSEVGGAGRSRHRHAGSSRPEDGKSPRSRNRNVDLPEASAPFPGPAAPVRRPRRVSRARARAIASTAWMHRRRPGGCGSPRW
jgi:hypothetical protein